jgi:GntP family gluconate:H+ symporter
MDLSPFLILLIGIGAVLGLIIGLRANAFLALIVAAFVVSILAPGAMAEKITRVAGAFGSAAASVGIIIALAALIGRLMMESGAADRIVTFFLSLLGEKRGGTALAVSGFVLSIPVFFDTVFYLLVPLARSMFRKTGRNYVKYLMAITAGGVVTHTLVPPTPGPLVIADTLNVSLGVMIAIGALIALPSAIVGLAFGSWMDRKMNIAMRPLGDEPETAPVDDAKLPSLFGSLLPIALPIVLVTIGSILSTLANAERAAQFKPGDITDWPAFQTALRVEDSKPAQRLFVRLPENVRQLIASSQPLGDAEKTTVLAGLNKVLVDRDFYDYETFVGTSLSDAARELLKGNRQRMQVAIVERHNRLLLESTFPQVQPHTWNTPRRRAANAGEFFGDPNFALLLATVAAMLVYLRQRKPSRAAVAHSVESALMSGGVIILITAAGGAFGAMLGQAQIGSAIEEMFGSGNGMGKLGLLCLAFAMSSLFKFAQGSSTVAMITAAGMVAAMIDPATLGFHPVYLATAIGSGSLVGSWMNDSGFWIFCKMGGLTEAESLRSWTPLLAICGITAMIFTLILAVVLPMSPN